MRPAFRSVTRGRTPLSSKSSKSAAIGGHWIRSTHTASTKYVEVTHPDDDVPASVAEQINKLNRNVLNTYARPQMIMTHGDNSWIYSSTGKKFLDFSGGIAVNSLGHSDKELAKVMQEQASKLLHASNLYHNEWAGQLATLLVDLTKRDGGLGWPAGRDNKDSTATAKVFFSNSGTEANEAALKFARKAGKERWAQQGAPGTRNWEDSPKTRIVCFANSFHGRTMGALSVTINPKYQKPFEPMIPNIDIGRINDIPALQTLITEDTCGVILEPIQGEGGIDTSKEEFLRALRKRCDEVGAVLIFDEIQCGLYRAGTLWSHAAFPTDCHPDMVTMAKPLANGFPLGAVMVRGSVADVVTIGSHGTTFGGSVLATRLGHHVLSRLSDPAFLANLRDTTAHVQQRVSKFPEFFPDVIKPAIRGRGLIIGIGFHNLDHPAKLMKMARERGVLILTAGKDAVRFLPNLTLSKGEADYALDVVESCLGLIAKGA